MLHPGEIHGLLAFWDFSADGPHHPATAGKANFVLVEQCGPIEKVHNGVFGKMCPRIGFGQWYRLERSGLGELDIHGHTPLTMLVWACPDSSRLWQFLAGVWNERDARRQYALFYNGAWQFDFIGRRRTACQHRVHAYLSHEGGHTPGDPACFSYATGATEIVPANWHCFALRWDGRFLEAWLDGRLDVHPGHNPLPFEGSIFSGGRAGADFTIAQRCMAAWRDYPAGRMPTEEGFSGLLGGVAVYNRALEADEMRALAGNLSHMK